MSSITTPDPATAAASAASDTSAAPPNPSSEAQEVSQSADPSVPDPATAVASTSTEAAPPLSKKAQKKLAKAAWLAERKKERRAVEKERRKEKKRAFAEKRAAGELDPEDEERERKRLKVDKGPRTPFAARVVVDLGFDEKMTENVSTIACSGVVVLTLGGAGGQVALIAARVYVQREQEGTASILLASVHFVKWTDAHAYGRYKSFGVQEMGRR